MLLNWAARPLERDCCFVSKRQKLGRQHGAALLGFDSTPSLTEYHHWRTAAGLTSTSHHDTMELYCYSGVQGSSDGRTGNQDSSAFCLKMWVVGGWTTKMTGEHDGTRSFVKRERKSHMRYCNDKLGSLFSFLAPQPLYRQC
jgi:hypothetical protein